MVTIEIDDKKVEARQGQMIIEAADSVGIRIPRFCYHKKLSIAANCRMCLVEVEKAPKPMPACATPVSEGMKIFTTSNKAIDAQKAVMEFLLINHPLDCPICDQGGQCELQDVALEYGKDTSRFVERKRVVKDKDIGPLISTEMTRCIHCTRCVRFGSEVAGQRELGATGRGEFMEIGTYIEKSVNSELSGNVIDLCPVGALTSKPFRFQARAWELKAHASVSMHDCLGSNLYFHTHNNQVKRALPRENEAINEVWLSDRDRFSYEGLNHTDRLSSPMIKKDNRWKKVDWPTALSFAVERLQKITASQGKQALGAIASPNCTVEEFFLLQKLFKSQGCLNVDHRLRQVDNAQQAYMGSFPTMGLWLTALEEQESIVLIGCDVKKEQPLVNHRIRKAATHGGHVFSINPFEIQANYDAITHVVHEQGDFRLGLMEIVKALMGLCDKEVLADCPVDAKDQLASITPSEQANDIANRLMATQKNSVLLGAYASSHPLASEIYWLARILAHLIGGTFGEMSNGANSAGGWLAGAIPHRSLFGQPENTIGLSAYEMFEKPRSGYVLVNCEPEYDCANPSLALEALNKADTVVALSVFDSPQLREYADVILPITPISEMTGTYINAFGDWARFNVAATPFGQSRPAWKVLRVMANLWDVPGFEYQSVEDVLGELLTLKGTIPHFADNLLSMHCKLSPIQARTKLVRLAPVGLYHVDGITRRAESLQKTQDGADFAKIGLNSVEAKNLGLKAQQKVWVFNGKTKSVNPLPLYIDDKLPNGVVIVPSSLFETQSLGAPFSFIDLNAAQEGVK